MDIFEQLDEIERRHRKACRDANRRLAFDFLAMLALFNGLPILAVYLGVL